MNLTRFAKLFFSNFSKNILGLDVKFGQVWTKIGISLDKNWDFATYFGKPPRPGNNRGIDPVLELDTVHEGLLVGRRDDFSDTLTKTQYEFS